MPCQNRRSKIFCHTFFMKIVQFTATVIVLPISKQQLNKGCIVKAHMFSLTWYPGYSKQICIAAQYQLLTSYLILSNINLIRTTLSMPIAF